MTEKHERGLITTIGNDTDNTIDEGVTTTRKQKWEGKQLYDRFKRLINNISHQKTWGCPRGVMVNDELRNRSTRVRTPVALLRSLSGKYPWEKYEPLYPPSYGLNSTTTVLLWH